MRNGEIRRSTDVLLLDARGLLPRRQSACGLDDGEIAANPIEPVLDRNAGREQQILVSNGDLL